MKVDEPVTTLSDYALALVLVTLSVLVLVIRPGSPSVLWAGGFLASAIAAALGGTSHGFGSRLSARLSAVLWRITLLLALAANALLLMAVALDHATEPFAQALIGFAAVTWVIAAVVAWRRSEYRVVVYDSTVTVAVVFLIEIVRLTAPSAIWIIGGALLATLGAVVQRSGFRRGKSWNHNDAYHVIQAVAFYALFRGATA